MSNQRISRAEFFESLGTRFGQGVIRLLRTPMGQILLACLALALCVGLGFALWQDRDLIAGGLIFLLVLFGVYLACELLPFSEATRARWQHSRELDQRYPSRRGRWLLWLGLSGTIAPIQHAIHRGGFELSETLLPVSFICIGGISHIVWSCRRDKDVR